MKDYTSYLKNNDEKYTMKNLLFLLLLALSSSLYSQEFITDANFKDKINSSNIVIVEFWAEFNQDNAFSEWNKIKGGPYYRVNITDAPSAKKKYRIRMAPTMIIFKDGDKTKNKVSFHSPLIGAWLNNAKPIPNIITIKVINTTVVITNLFLLVLFCF